MQNTIRYMIYKLSQLLIKLDKQQNDQDFGSIYNTNGNKLRVHITQLSQYSNK